jgi:hypothetical protein
MVASDLSLYDRWLWMILAYMINRSPSLYYVMDMRSTVIVVCVSTDYPIKLKTKIPKR